MSYDEDEDRSQSAIDKINCLYPPDSDYPETAMIGRQDLIDAICLEWRSLPTPVLENIARVQQQREQRGAGS